MGELNTSNEDVQILTGFSNIKESQDAVMSKLDIILKMLEPPTVKVKRLENGEGLNLPTKMTEGSSGADLQAAIEEESTLIVAPGSTVIVPTGFSFEIPIGFEMQVRPRSGLAAKKGITVLNTPGTVDADYRGEVKVIIMNHGKEDFVIYRGDRIAQAVVMQVPETTYVEVDSLSDTVRGDGGFGHTGKSS